MSDPNGEGCQFVVDALGYVWRTWPDRPADDPLHGTWSMARVNPDNSPIPQPVTRLIPDPVGASHLESWETWDGSYQQAYLRGRADAATQPPLEVEGDPMPSVTLVDVWHELSGYVQQAAEDQYPIIAADFLAYMAELRYTAYRPVHEWWHRHYDRSADALPDPPSPWETDPAVPSVPGEEPKP